MRSFYYILCHELLHWVTPTLQTALFRDGEPTHVNELFYSYTVDIVQWSARAEL